LSLSGNHFFLGVSGLDLTLLDCFFGLDNFVELLLAVAEFAALRLNEQVLRRREVEGELLVLLVVGLGGFGAFRLLLLLLTHF